MKTWLLSVTAVILMSVLLELILSEGKIKKYIQGILRLALVVAIILPLIRLVKTDFSFDFVFDEDANESIVDDSFLSRIHSYRYAEAEKKIVAELKSNGISNALVDIVIYYAPSGSAEVDYVSVDITQSVITVERENIILTEMIKNTVKSVVDVSEDRIVIYGVN